MGLSLFFTLFYCVYDGTHAFIGFAQFDVNKELGYHFSNEYMRKLFFIQSYTRSDLICTVICMYALLVKIVLS